MRDKYFIDTNVFIYSFDNKSIAKQKKAQSIIETALTKRTGVISTQVIGEFFNVALSKFKQPLQSKDAHAYLKTTLRPLCQIFHTTSLYAKALSLNNEFKFGFYDCLIIAAALDGNCTAILTEDLQHEQEIEGVTIINPFVD